MSGFRCPLAIGMTLTLLLAMAGGGLAQRGVQSIWWDSLYKG